MGAASHLAGRKLPGKRSKKLWTVVKEIEPDNDHTPGQFSVGYIVESENGETAFMKASDLNLMMGSEGDDLIARIQGALSAHQFERSVLEYCHGSNMDRIVTAIDHGDCPVVVDGIQDAVFYLIFELAKCDLRSQVVEKERADDLWRITALHHMSIAIQQLHHGGICHNDIKPANCLVIDSSLQKLADLGQATSLTHPAAHDENHNVGDHTYAAPEILYAQSKEECKSLCQREGRRASDLYQLGSIATYLFTGRMITPSVVSRLAPPHRPPSEQQGWGSGFPSVLPYWRHEFNEVMAEFESSLRSGRTLRQFQILCPLLEAVRYLSEPDPHLRGHPINRQGAEEDVLGLRRFVSLFNEIRSRLLIVK